MPFRQGLTRSSLHHYCLLKACGDYSVTTKRQLVKILYFRQFHKHFVFIDDGEGGRKKILKNYIDVNVCIDMVCGDTNS